MSTRARFADQLEKALRAVPGFETASVSGDIPLAGGNRTLYTRPENASTPIAERAAAPSHDIPPGYLKTWGVPLLAGRDFDERDLTDRPHVMLISQSGARKVFGDENPIGKTLLVTSNSVPAEIIGIVGDVRSERPAQRNDMEFYRPLAQENFPFLSLTVRSTFPNNEITRLAEKALASVDPTLAIAQPQMMSAIVAQAMGQARLTTILLGVFAAVAFLLATVGIYGAVAYSVGQRTGEIGVRMALGAQTRDVLRLIVGQGMKPVLLGLLAGLGAALALGRLITAQLYQTSAHSPVLLLGTLALLALAALVACLLPARRATLVNPVEALRAD
jgi:putative ABC transport system permease protein